jgi:membrane associated rhomboid family serine protease
MLVLIGFSPRADVLAHVGGFLFGVTGGMIWLLKNPAKETGRGGEI